ncbi:MAG TPA: hypothetical protein VN821_08940 [Candidatus Udaeobacter sp.]|nr:hypothetical protein [Candidatus Udaeobacter sp.]
MKKAIIGLAILAVLLAGGAWGYFHFLFDRPMPVGCGLPLKPRCLAEAARRNSEPDGIAGLFGLDRMLPGEAPDNVVVDALALSGDAEAASVLAATLPSPAARAAAYRRLAVDAARAGKMAEAKAAATAAVTNAELLTAGSSQRLEAAGDAAVAEAAAGDLAAARDRLSASAGSAAVLADGSDRDDAFAALAPAMAVVGEGSEALDTAGKIRDAAKRDQALAAIAVALSATSDPLVDRAMAAIANTAWRVVALAQSAEAAAAAAQADSAAANLAAAAALASAIPDAAAADRDRAYGALALAEAELGRLDDAAANLQDCGGDLSRLAVLTEITARQAAAGDGTTLKTLDQVQAIVSHLNGTTDYAAAQGWLAAAQAALGDGDGALATLEAIQSGRARAFALARVAVALARAGQS